MLTMKESYTVKFRAYRTQLFWTATMMYSIPPIVCEFAYKGLHGIYNSIYTTMYSIPPIVHAFAYKGLHDIYNSIYKFIYT